MATKKPLTVSNAQAFRKKKLEYDEGTIIELPSGLVVKVKRPSVPHMIKAGRLPASLAAAQFRMQTSNSEASDKDIERLYQLQLKIVELTLIEPKVTSQNPDYEAGEISIEDIEPTDCDAIYAWVNGGDEALSRFRDGGAGLPAGPGSA